MQLAWAISINTTNNEESPALEDQQKSVLRLSIILLFSQQTESSRSLSRPKNSHANRRKKRKIKITHHRHYEKLA